MHDVLWPSLPGDCHANTSVTFLLLEKKLELGKLNNKSILPLPSNGAAMPKISELYPGWLGDLKKGNDPLFLLKPHFLQRVSKHRCCNFAREKGLGYSHQIHHLDGLSPPSLAIPCPVPLSPHFPLLLLTYLFLLGGNIYRKVRPFHQHPGSAQHSVRCWKCFTACQWQLQPQGSGCRDCKLAISKQKEVIFHDFTDMRVLGSWILSFPQNKSFYVVFENYLRREQTTANKEQTVFWPDVECSCALPWHKSWMCMWVAKS